METLLNEREYTRTGYGKLQQTSENELVLTALASALARMKKPAELIIMTGNRYLLSVLENGWAESWKREGWVNKAGKQVSHAGMWEEITNGLAGHELKLEPGIRHKYHHWQKFQLGKLENVDFIKWEEGLSPPDPIYT